MGKLTEKMRNSSFQDEKAKVIQTMVFVTGINTLLQVNFGTRLPVVIGSSHTFILPILSIIFNQRYSDILNPHEVILFVLSHTFSPLRRSSIYRDGNVLVLIRSEVQAGDGFYHLTNSSDFPRIQLSVISS